MTIDGLKDILDEYFDIGWCYYAYYTPLKKSEFENITTCIETLKEFDECATQDIAEYIVDEMNRPCERDIPLLNVGNSLVAGGYISKVEVLADVVRYYLENGAVIEMERKK